MSNQSSSNLRPRPLPRRVISVSNLSGGLVLFICVIFMFVLLFRIESDVKARYAMLGVEFGENRNLIENTRLIPADTKEIYLQFYLESRANGTIPLEFRWYAGDQLAYTSSGTYEDGYVIASFKPDSNKPGGFPTGNYHVEVWFRNTVILSKAFVVE